VPNDDLQVRDEYNFHLSFNVKLRTKTCPSIQLKVQERILYYIGMAVFKNSSWITEIQLVYDDVYGKRKVFKR
jgi:hypothetical protein